LTADADTIRTKARSEAQTIVERAQVETDRIIRELRQMRERSGVKAHELVELRKGLEGLTPEAKRQAGVKSGVPERGLAVRPGGRVKVLSLDQKGDVLDVSSDGKSATIQLGQMKMKIDMADPDVLQTPKETTQIRHSMRTETKDIRMEMDVRGESVDEALLRIDKYLDDAVVTGLARVVIIHGKGTGALRQAVRRHLERPKQVKSNRAAGQGEGGDGATVVTVRM